MEDNEKKAPVTEGEPVKEEKPGKKPAKKQEKKLRGRRRLFADYQYDDVKKKNGKVVRRKVYKGKYYGYVIPEAYKKNADAYIRRIKLSYVLFFIALVIVWMLPSLVLNAQGLGTVVYADEIKGYSYTPSDSAIAEAGLIPTIGAHYFYVLLPYLVCTLPLLLMFMTLLEFIFTKGNRHEQAFMEALSQNMRGQTVTLIVSSAITAIGEIVFILTNYKVIRSSVSEVGVTVLMLAEIGISIFYLRRQAGYPMETKK